MTSILSLCQDSTNDSSDTCIYHFVYINIFCLTTNGAQPLDCRLGQKYHQRSMQAPNYLAFRKSLTVVETIASQNSATTRV